LKEIKIFISSVAFLQSKLFERSNTWATQFYQQHHLLIEMCCSGRETKKKVRSEKKQEFI